ncbi:MAG: DNA methyltransferase [Methanobacteriota archaeon]
MTAAFGYPLVEDILDHLSLAKGAIVLDPVCGTGTVPVVCQSRGLESIGIELNPFLADLSRLKTSAHQLGLEELEPNRPRIIRLARKLAKGYGKLSVGEIGRVVPLPKKMRPETAKSVEPVPVQEGRV